MLIFSVFMTETVCRKICLFPFIFNGPHSWLNRIRISVKLYYFLHPQISLDSPFNFSHTRFKVHFQSKRSVEENKKNQLCVYLLCLQVEVDSCEEIYIEWSCPNILNIHNKGLIAIMTIQLESPLRPDGAEMPPPPHILHNFRPNTPRPVIQTSQSLGWGEGGGGVSSD